MQTPGRVALLLTSALFAFSAAPGAWAQGAGAPPPPANAAPSPDAGTPPAASADPQPKTPLPPRDAPRAAQPNSATAGTTDDSPKTALPPRDTPRAPQPGQKAAVADPDWPCVQRKVSELSYGQMWGGPPLDDALIKWRDDEEVSNLVAKIVARRTSIDQAKTAINDFAQKAGDKKNAKLTLLFAGLFDELNGERSHVVNGIERFARKQRALSEKIRTESVKMGEVNKDMASQMSDEGQKAQQTLDWDTRIYDERSQSLTYVCETPVILEQRAFDLGREIQNLMNAG